MTRHIISTLSHCDAASFRVAVVSALMTAASTMSATLPELHSPLDIPLVLSGNFGELRPNHFHSGLDFKTQGRTGLPVYAADDGYVSRVVVSPTGFGRAVYITHPEQGITTVYGHLQEFSPQIDTPVRKHQYDTESFRVDLTFKPGEIEVKRGDRIALSGNAGSSGGPHLHMDVRDTHTEEALDPMPYFRNRITDTTSPEVRSVALYPVKGEGVVGTPAVKTPAQLSVPFTAWGEVAPGIKAYDRMDGTSNIYGVKYLTLTVDGDTIFNRTVNSFSFDETRAVNTLVDYAGVVNSGSWTMWSLRPEALPLKHMISSRGRGTITIDQERPYRCTWILADEHGNTRRSNFTIQGKRMNIPEVKAEGSRMDHAGFNIYTGDGAKVFLPASTLYDRLDFKMTSRHDARFVSPVWTVGDPTVPISGEYRMTLNVNPDSVADTSKLYVVRVTGKGNRPVDSTYADGAITATPNSFGSFAVATDTKAPVITPETSTKKRQLPKNRVSYIISDQGSGIDSWRGEVDGKWALFEFDAKTGRLSYTFDPSRVERGKSHNVTLTVTDRCGNSSTHTRKVTW